jgi:hypothetical protein
MADRFTTPDVLGSIMSGIAIKQENNKAIKKEKKILKTTPVEAFEDLKEKATFNLPVKLLEELEDKCYEIRKLAGSKQISKTLIVEEALRMAFADFESKEKSSKLYSKLTSNKAVKQ